MILTSSHSDRTNGVSGVAALAAPRSDTSGAVETFGSLQYNRIVLHAMARELHPHFMSLAQNGFQGMVIVDTALPGALCDAFAANDGASKYVRGSLVHRSTPDAFTLATDFLASHALQSELILSVVPTADGHEVRLSDSIGGGAARVTSLSSHAPLEDSLLALGRWLEERRGVAGIESVLRALQASRFTADSTMLPDGSEQVRSENRALWGAIRELAAEALPTILVGESFTFGKLASLLSADCDGFTSPLSTFYGWYHPSFKEAVGVPARCVTDEQIVTINTVARGAHGLLESFGAEHAIAIGTSGWANHWEAGQCDYFAVALESRAPGSLCQQALLYRVDTSEQWERARPRRELTRELGVSAALLLIARERAAVTSGARERWQGLADVAQALLEQHGTIVRG